MIKFLFIVLDFFNFISSADDFKGVLGAIAGLFGLSKVWDFWQKRNDNETKVKQAKIEAEKEIKSNRGNTKAKIYHPTSERRN